MNSSNAEWLVIDAGVGYALSVMDAETSSLRADVTANVRRGTQLCAPTLWRYELTSIFTKAIYFGQLTKVLAGQALALSSEIAITLVTPDDELVRQAYDWTLRLKRAAAYDSFYLALARRLDCMLWTTDRHLANAVAEPWIRYVGNMQQDPTSP